MSRSGLLTIILLPALSATLPTEDPVCAVAADGLARCDQGRPEGHTVLIQIASKASFRPGVGEAAAQEEGASAGHAATLWRRAASLLQDLHGHIRTWTPSRWGGPGQLSKPGEADSACREAAEGVKDKVAQAAKCTPKTYEVVQCSKQVVAGMNFFLKLKLDSCGPSGFVHACVFQPLGQNATYQLTATKIDVSKDTQLEYIEKASAHSGGCSGRPAVLGTLALLLATGQRW
mmetsp:Transcript_123600/g.384826  ORF Transcript_123600/g.384826 Transcript_123600/m.384826 type:complete len:232 (-) Transcript_123600:40-735(-)